MQNTIIASRERYRGVVDRKKDYLLKLNKDYEISFINRRYAAYFGSGPQKLIGCSYKSLVHESTHDLLFSILDDVRSGSATMTVELQILDAKGLSHWQEWNFAGILSDNGQVSEIQCIGRDVTDKKFRADTVEAKEEKIRRLAEVTSDLLWETDKSDVYTFVSPVVYGLLGYRPEEVLGKSPFDFMPANEAKRMKRIFEKLKSEGRPLKNIENIILHKNGSKITLETSGSPIFDRSGAVIGYRGIGRDVTVRKMAEENLSKQTTKRPNMSVKNSRGSNRLVPICASCKMVRDEKNTWNQIEDYLEAHFNINFSHGICPECVKRWYPEVFGGKKL